MKLTLEKAELIQLIGKSLGYEIQDDDITVHADPFEVHIQNVDLAGMAASQEPVGDPLDIDDIPPYHQDPNFDEEEEQGEDDPENVMTMSDVLNLNSGLGGPTAPPTVIEDEPERPLGPNESTDPPPFTDEEMFAKR